MTEDPPPAPPLSSDPAPTRRRRSGLRRRPPFRIGDLEVRAGRRETGELPVPRLVTGTRISLPLRVVHGRHEGPTIWISSSIHGDEIGGVEIIRRVNEDLDPRSLAGTVIMVPIVNVHGFLVGDRYLPDRRDLNRSFPGSATGSLASRIAHVFMEEVVARSDVGIDLHTGSDHRTNLPQVRGDLDDPRTRDLAEAFGAPVMLHARVRDGSLRAAGTAAGKTVLLFEGGEALRFDPQAITAGVDGIHRVLARLDMDSGVEVAPPPVPVASRKSAWIRARRSGIVSLDVALGDRVAKGERVAVVHDSLGRRLSQARARFDGIIIGHTQHPLGHQGDALVHVARIADLDEHDGADGPPGVPPAPDRTTEPTSDPRTTDPDTTTDRTTTDRPEPDSP
ncbi:succinylglutamate desuccinylase/aspartoacylase family protein [Salsipaludibacter albus]|uniref:succinylglutamate desuccinylase/aspartoacylase family protein n=1 Tax=Salsipaludibacter albus TaxID=2849650 RepID=UPI0023674B38|nr:succinylglutamate desuccinylase/aspartoacylase family protein [Salsipaludibacter albus]MBY5162475.1 succinylglutamate desuccinylase/aspartoacylase family protein [Salsipaludibacter albus]